MLRRLIYRLIAREERRLGGSLDYLRHIASTSLPAFVKFGLFTPLAAHRRAAPLALYHAARLVAVQEEDCGTCVQMEVNFARQAGVPREVIRAVLDGRVGALPEDVADAYHFARAVAGRTGGEAEPRERLRARHGDATVVELALGIAASRVYPVTKRALGYAVACERVTLNV